MCMFVCMSDHACVCVYLHVCMQVSVCVCLEIELLCIPGFPRTCYGDQAGLELRERSDFLCLSSVGIKGSIVYYS